MWIPPLPVRLPGSEDYTSLGQDDHPSEWLPALLGLMLFFGLLLVATAMGKV